MDFRINQNGGCLLIPVLSIARHGQLGHGIHPHLPESTTKLVFLVLVKYCSDTTCLSMMA